MKIAVCICTYNRSHLLQQTLSRMCNLKLPLTSEVHFIIINNNSKDTTAEVISEYAALLPLTTVFEATPGLSNARNCAIDKAVMMGIDYIIWTDDDVLPAEDWIIQYESAFIKYPEASIFGGTVEAWFAVPPPKWLIESWESVKHAYAVRELGDESFQLQPVGPNIPFGANFSIRVREQIKLKYDPNMGVIGNKRLGGEETGVMRKLLQDGATGWWLPNARVKHYLEAERLTFAYIGKYHRGYGITLAKEALSERKIKAGLYKNRWVIKMVLKSSFLFILNFVTKNRRQAIVNYIDVNIAIGRCICLSQYALKK